MRGPWRPTASEGVTTCRPPLGRARPCNPDQTVLSYRSACRSVMCVSCFQRWPAAATRGRGSCRPAPTCLRASRAASVASASLLSCSLLMLSTMSVYLLSALALQHTGLGFGDEGCRVWGLGNTTEHVRLLLVSHSQPLPCCGHTVCKAVPHAGAQLCPAALTQHPDSHGPLPCLHILHPVLRGQGLGCASQVGATYLLSGMSPANRFSVVASRLVGGTDLTSRAPVMAGTSAGQHRTTASRHMRQCHQKAFLQMSCKRGSQGGLKAPGCKLSKACCLRLRQPWSCQKT